MSITLLQGIVPIEFKRVKTNDLLITGAHIDEFNGAYSLSPIPTANINELNVRNHDKNYLHTTNSGYRFFFHQHWTWVLSNNTPSPVDAEWDYTTHADAYYRIVPMYDSDGIAVFPPDPSIPGHLVFYAKEGLYTAVIPHSPGRVEVIRSRNTRFNGVYDEEGEYNDRPYYRRGESGFGIIFCDQSWDLNNPSLGPYNQPRWCIVDDLPSTSFDEYYIFQEPGQYITNCWFDGGYSPHNSPVEVEGYDYSFGDANDLSLTITEINL